MAAGVVALTVSAASAVALTRTAPPRERLEVTDSSTPSASASPAPAVTPSGPSRPRAGTAADLPVTPALKREIRDSYYRAYRADPTPEPTFGAPAGEPASAVVGPRVDHAGVVYGENPAHDEYWVVGAICIGSTVGCQDGGAVQAFHRIGPTGLFSRSGPCSIPTRLFGRWYPHGLPMGISCPPDSAFVITRDGWVGHLRLDVSTKAEIVATLGQPSAQDEGWFGDPMRPDRFLALAYDCSSRHVPAVLRVRNRYCRTAYFVDRATGKFAGFTTMDPRFRTSRGSRVGTPGRTASRNEGAPLHLGGCTLGVQFGTARADIRLDVDGQQQGVPVVAISATASDPLGMYFC